MAKDRQKSGYIWGKDQLKYINLPQYKKALDSKDISTEEYYYQSAFHSSVHANNLKKEIFQKKIRNHVTNKSAEHFDIPNPRPSENINNNVTPVMCGEDTFANLDYSPETKTSIMHMISEIVSYCNSDQIKVFAYFIVSEKIDAIVVDDFCDDPKFDEIRTYILQIWELNVNNINSLIKFIGSKYRTEIARRSLTKLIKEKFPLLSKF